MNRHERRAFPKIVANMEREKRREAIRGPRKMTTPLKYFKRFEALTDLQHNYVLEYKSRVAPKDKATLELIEELLKKPVVPDVIIHRFDVVEKKDEETTKESTSKA